MNVIALVSHGIPRLINAICDGALTNAFGQGFHQLDDKQIMAVVKDLDLTLPAVPAVETAPAPVSPPARRLAPAIGPIRLFDSERIEPPPRSVLSRWSRRLGLVD